MTVMVGSASVRVAAFLGAAALLLAATWAAVTPRWESNDDAAMAMVAHGFGGADHASAQLVFSSIAWGTLVKAIGLPGGIPGYTFATFAGLAVALATLLWAARAARLGLPGMVGVAGLLFARAAMFPQFTLGAGLLAIAGAAALAWYPRSRSPLLLAAAVALVATSFAVRREECALVLVVLAPALPWRMLAREVPARVAATCLALSLGGISAWDASAYARPEWDRFNQLNPSRAAFTDYGRAELIKGRPEILERHGLSSNDVDLVAGWFFADRVLADPDRLRAAVRDLGQVPHVRQDLGNAGDAVLALRNSRLQWLLLAAILAGLLFPGWRIAACWLVCLAALAGIGYAGRPGVLRVYEPLLGALVLAPFMRQAATSPGVSFSRLLFPGWPLAAAWLLCLAALAAIGYVGETTDLRMYSPLLGALVLAPFLRQTTVGQSAWAPHARLWVAAAGLAVLASFQLRDVLRQRTVFAIDEAAVHQELAQFPSQTVVVWGDAFPFELAAAPLVPQATGAGPRLYGLGTFTFAPFAVSAVEEARGRDMLSLMNGTQGALLLARDRDVDRLAIYCLEHFDGRLEAAPVHNYSFGRLRRVWCRT